MKPHNNFNDYLPEGVTLSPRAVEEQATLAFWNENDIFQETIKKPESAGDYIFYEGPPTANGHPGMHHVEARSFKDLIPRYKTMRGFRVHRKAGWDTHGLPVELQVEKKLGLKSKKEIEAYGVEAFNRECRASVWQYKSEWESMTTRMGYWVDMDNPYVTYENRYIEALWGVMKKVNDDGFLYRDFKVLPWCSRCGTALSTHELNQPGAYQDVKDLSVYAKFKVVGNSEKGIGENTNIVAWTTTPWTLPGNVALAVGADIDYVKVKTHKKLPVSTEPLSVDSSGNGNISEIVYLVISKDVFGNSEFKKILEKDYVIVSDETVKGSDLVGLSYEPLFPYLKNEVEKQGGENAEKLANAYRVYAADFVTTTDGTGVVHIAPMYGADDFDLGTANNLPKFHTVGEDGKFVESCGLLAGRYVKEQDENGKPTVAVDIVDYLKENNLWFANENYPHSYPHCWRCDTPLLYYARSSWYIRMSQLRDHMVAGNLGDGDKPGINWEPENIREGRFGEWLANIRDWAISRDRYWGTPIPVWETATGKRVVIGSIHDIKKYAKKTNKEYYLMRHARAVSNERDIHSEVPFTEYDDLVVGATDAIDQQYVSSNIGQVDVIYVSEFRRAQKTAEYIASLMPSKPQIIIDPALNERSYSLQLDGKTFEELRQTPSYKTYDSANSDGESQKNLLQRTYQFMQKVESSPEGKKVLIVAHGGTNKTLEVMAAGVSEENFLKEWKKSVSYENAQIRPFEFTSLPRNEYGELDFHKPFIDNVQLELDGEPLVRTPEVMDVWFDSGAMPFAQFHELGEPLDTDIPGKFPAQFISEAIDQTRGWFYTLHAVAALMGKPRAYDNVICLGHIMDATGKKMSKSKGNIVSPWKMFANYGADSIRMWMYSVNQPGESKNFDEKTVGELENKFFRMLDNCVAFYELYAASVSTAGVNPRASENVLDQWILALLDKTIVDVTKSLDEYNAFTAARTLREFVPELSQWYVRRSRDRVKDETSTDAQFAVATMKYVYEQFALLMAPFAPFAAESLYKKLGGTKESVHLESWPEIHPINEVVITDMQRTRNIVSEALEIRARNGIKVRQPLSLIKIPLGFLKNKISSPVYDLRDYYHLIQDEVNVKNVETDLESDTVWLDLVITPELQQLGDLRDIIRSIQQLRKESGLLPGQYVTLRASSSVYEFLQAYPAELEKVTVTLSMDANLTAGTAIQTEGVTGYIAL